MKLVCSTVLRKSWIFRFLLFPVLWLGPGVAPLRSAVPARPAVGELSDPVAWLENARDPAVREWSAVQNRLAIQKLRGLETRPWIEERLQQLMIDRSPRYSAASWRSDRLFVLKAQAASPQPVLVTLNALTNLGSERVVLDPNRLSTNRRIAIDWYAPSRDGRLAAVSLSESGQTNGTLFIYESATGQRRSDVLRDVHGLANAGSAAWNADGSGLFYTRGPAENGRVDVAAGPQVYFHRLGSAPAQDTYELGREFPPGSEVQLQASPDGERILASVVKGSVGEWAHYLREPGGTWRQVAGYQDRITRAQFGRDPLYLEAGKDAAIYFLSFEDAAQGRIVRWPYKSLSVTNRSVVVPAGSHVLVDFFPTASGLAVKLIDAGVSELRFFDFYQNKLQRIGEHGTFGVAEVAVMRGDTLLYREVSYDSPDAWWQFNPTHDRPKVELTRLTGQSTIDFSDIELVRESVRSKDGTKIPLSILKKKGTRLTSDNPTILTGYGAFGVCLEPEFEPTRRIWLDQGGVFALARVRGGGDNGERWHEAGRLLRKERSVEDFVACAQFLVRSNYTRPGRLAVQASGPGGLLAGALLTQQPDLIQAVVVHDGLFDLFKPELEPNRALYAVEFGTKEDPRQALALAVSSPLQHVVAGLAYPAILLVTGTADERVNPAQSRKMAARLQMANPPGADILFRTRGAPEDAGAGWEEGFGELVDTYSFLFDRLGVDYSRVYRGPWSGAVTPTTAMVKAKVVRSGLPTRLAVSEDGSLTNLTFSPATVTEATRGNVVSFSLSQLHPNTRYRYALEIDGRLERSKAGELRTFPPPGPASFEFAFASCARTGSTSDVFDQIRANHPLFFLHMGDFHYLDIQTNSRPRFRAAYDAVLASPQQSDMFRSVPIMYMWDDHDFGGNNSNRRAPSHEAARLTYEEFVPHYPLVFDLDGPICQTFAVGRVKFIVTDLRSQRDRASGKDGPTKSMMGERQKAWFKQELLRANGQYPLICWVSTVPWIGTLNAQVYKGVRSDQYGYIHHTNLLTSTNALANHSKTNSAATNALPTAEDHWAAFATERREIADFIKVNQIRGLCILHGDSHMLAADDGSNSDYATGGGVPLPVMCAAPMDQDPSLKGGPYSQGIYRVRKGEGCFGWITIRDLGDRIEVAYSGRNNRNEEKVALHFAVPAPRP